MTETSTPVTIRVDQFVAAPPGKVWRLLTEPDLLRLWWADGDVAAVVGHQFTLDMPGYGKQPCAVLEVDPPRRFVHTFTSAWTLTWRLEPEGSGTRVFLEHSGFDLDDTRMAMAFDRMGAGWRDVVLPRLADAVTRV
ncbi:polyketide cyclase [Mycobacterium malmoense]|uniref:Polyketide cyclase n=1 Tax=Mycobacterium malmoense TaxID=1780 RepID=A0A1B9DA64_MYCMA|nr:SRPBCC domain-containing protein [Mycobacterium malmoense]OCB28498.1 polyketide cyclase [Mycobacterium malmoense]OCB34782.1 polyketide cyclase [Mycobacterium malmoense]OCB41114.1 polyketide cyclase [Mycobacterium malmoense]OCB57432.1 polyketide cyclase [Mycobacterium malmoense]